MAFHVRDPETDRLVRELAAEEGLGLTEAVKLALQNELRRIAETLPLRERLRPLQERVLARAATGFEADKPFYDEVSGNS